MCSLSLPVENITSEVNQMRPSAAGGMMDDGDDDGGRSGDSIPDQAEMTSCGGRSLSADGG